MTAIGAFDPSRLLSTSDSHTQELEWERLVTHNTRLLLAVAHTFGPGHDAAMDRYAYILEALRADDFRRLRAFVPGGSARFSTWLVVIARRLCIDHHRARFGRTSSLRTAESEAQWLRRRLSLGLGEMLDLETIADDGCADPDEQMDRRARDGVVAGLLTSLPPRDQLLLQLRFHEGLGAVEIARLMHFPTPLHVYRRVNALLTLLRAQLASHPLFQRDA